jgi:hypothetical protein
MNSECYDLAERQQSQICFQNPIHKGTCILKLRLIYLEVSTPQTNSYDQINILIKMYLFGIVEWYRSIYYFYNDLLLFSFFKIYCWRNNLKTHKFFLKTQQNFWKHTASRVPNCFLCLEWLAGRNKEQSDSHFSWKYIYMSMEKMQTLITTNNMIQWAQKKNHQHCQIRKNHQTKITINTGKYRAWLISAT